MSKSACKSDSPLSTRENKGYIDAHQIVTESSSRSHSQIYEIDLHGSNITRISNLDQFCRITTLDLSCNVISRIEGLHSCTHLKELKLYSNKISRIEGLNKLKQLCHLTLQHNRIETIGSGLQSLQKLKRLRLDYNCLTRVSHHEFTGCPQLSHLDLSNNFLETVEGLDSLVQLEEIRLSNNKLTAMPVLFHCKKVPSGCNVCNLLPVFMLIIKLEEIDMSGNPLSVLPKSNSHHSLKRLLLERTGISCLKALGQIMALQELHVAHNSIAHLEVLQCDV
jgi:Leucine-rich repeat (LRR) protein